MIEDGPARICHQAERLCPRFRMGASMLSRREFSQAVRQLYCYEQYGAILFEKVSAKKLWNWNLKQWNPRKCPPRDEG